MSCCCHQVWREGQAKRVWIYRMLMAGSIEEKVLQRQLAKQGLSEALVDEVGQEVSRLAAAGPASLHGVTITLEAAFSPALLAVVHPIICHHSLQTAALAV